MTAQSPLPPGETVTLRVLDAFDLLSKLPPFLTIRHQTGRIWENASPCLTMIGSKIHLSYQIGEAQVTLYERAEDAEELQDAVQCVAKELEGKTELFVSTVFINGTAI